MDQELRIKIRVDKQTGELSAIGTEFDKLNDSTKKANTSTHSLSGAFMSFKGVLGTLGLGFLIKESIQMADTYKLVEGRLNLVSKSATDLATSQNELFKISQNTRQGYADTVDLYTRIARSTEALNKSQSDTLQVTEAINKSFIVSGASAQSASAAVMQLGQGFASGTLRGEELNSILEQAPRLAEAIAKGMNITVGELRKFGEEGKLSAEKVFESIKNQSSAIGDEFEKMPKIFGQAMVQMGNSLLNLIGYLDKSINATNALSNAISGVSKSVDNFTRGLKLSDMSTDTLDILNEKLNRLGSEWSELEGRKNLSIFSWDWLPEDAIIKKQKEIEGLISLLVSGKEGLYKLADDERLLKSEILPDRFSYTISPERQKEIDERIFTIQKDAQDKKLELAKKHSEEIKKIAEDTIKFNDEQFALLAQSSEKSIRQLDASIDFEEANKNAIKAIQDYNNAYMLYYEAIGDESKAYYFKEQLEIERLKELKILSDLEINEIIAKNREKFRDEQFEKENKWLYDYFDNINKALDNSLLDGFRTKFKNFGDWLENLFGSIGDSILASLSRSFAGSITSSLQSSIINSLKGASPLGGLSALAIGSSVSASEIGSLMNNGGVFDSATNSITTSGGSVIKLGADGGGTLSSGGSDLLGIASSISSLKTAYSVLTNGISGTLLNGFNSVANLTGIGGISQFGYGFANPFGSPLAGLYGSGVPELSGLASYGSMASAGLLGGAVGYGVGSLGDKLFGANTYAGVGGALGGATGGILGSLGLLGSIGGPLGMIGGSLLGSVLGGIFGKRTVTDTGYNFLSDATANNIDVMGYSDWKKKGWFSSSSGSNPIALSSSQIKEIEAVFTTYDYLLTQLGDSDKIFLEAGKYSKDTWKDAIAKNFITAFTDIPQQILTTVTTTTQNQLYDWWDGYFEEITVSTQEMVSNAQFDEIYQAWADYAETVDKTVLEALTESINAFVSSKRTFEIWSLGDSIEALAKKAQWAQSDFENLAQTLNVSGVTAENYLSMYEDAIKNSFTPETISQWSNLGTALMSASDALEAYNDALEAQEKALQSLYLSIDGVVKNVEYSLSGTDFKEVFDLYAQAFTDLTGIVVTDLATFNSAAEALKTSTLTQEEVTAYSNLGSALVNLTKSTEEARIAVVLANQAIKTTLLTTFSNAINSWESVEEAIANASSIASDTIRTFDELKNSSLDISNYQDLLDSLKATQEKEISIAQDSYDLRVKQLNNEKSLFEDLSSYVDELNIKLLGGNVTSDYFFKELDKAKATLASGGEVNTSNLTSTASSYLDYALQNSTSQLDYFREVAKVKEGIGSLGSMVTGGSLEGIQSAIASEEATLGFKLDRINETALAILSQWGSQAQLSKVSAVKTYAHIASDPVTSAFQEVLGRNPETDGYSYWMDRVVGGLTGEALKTEIANAALNFNIDTYTGSVSREAILASQANARNWINGSHASGIRSIPFDGYIAELHEGERIQTEKEARRDDATIALTREIEDLRKELISQKAQDIRLRQLFERLAPDGDALQTRSIA